MIQVILDFSNNISHSSISSIIWNATLINFLLLIIFIFSNFQQIFFFYRSQFHATGLYGDDETSELVSKTVSEMVPKLIKENQKLIVDNFIKICTQMLNKYLSTITFKDLLKMLGL